MRPTIKISKNNRKKTNMIKAAGEARTCYGLRDSSSKVRLMLRRNPGIQYIGNWAKTPWLPHLATKNPGVHPWTAGLRHRGLDTWRQEVLVCRLPVNYTLYQIKKQADRKIWCWGRNNKMGRQTNRKLDPTWPLMTSNTCRCTYGIWVLGLGYGDLGLGLGLGI